MSALRSIGVVVTTCALLLGCTSVYNLPANVPLAGASLDPNLDAVFKDAAEQDDLLIGFSFSGGGTRAAAFSFGVLEELGSIRMRVRVRHHAGAHRLFCPAFPAGSVTAAYYGLKKRAALSYFRERFLLQNAEAGLTAQLSLRYYRPCRGRQHQ